MTLTSPAGPVLVLGGTGKTGSRVAARLTERGVPVRIGSRAATPPFDWTDRRTWGPALAGCSATYVAYHPDIGTPPAADVVGALCSTAVEQGVGRIVLLSGRREEEAQRAEALLAATGADWTVLRCAWFAQNFTESFLLPPVLDGEVALPADGVLEPFVDADDVADVAVAALTADGHRHRVHELTGPRLLTFADAVGEIAAATGRPIAYRPVEVSAYTRALAEEGAPPDVVELVRYLFAEVLDGRNSSLGDGVQQALGRAPRDFGHFAADAARTGVWDAPGVYSRAR